MSTESLRSRIVDRVRAAHCGREDELADTGCIENALKLLKSFPDELLTTLDNEDAVAAVEPDGCVCLWWPGRIYDAYAEIGRSGFTLVAETPNGRYMVSQKPTNDAAALQTLFKAISELPQERT